MQGIWKDEPFKTSSSKLGAILYAHHSRWSGRKKCVLEEDLQDGTNWVLQEGKFTAMEGEFGLSMYFNSVPA